MMCICEQLNDEIKRLKAVAVIRQKALNDIDDFFEYAGTDFEMIDGQQHVYKVLDTMTKELKKLVDQ